MKAEENSRDFQDLHVSLCLPGRGIVFDGTVEGFTHFLGTLDPGLLKNQVGDVVGKALAVAEETAQVLAEVEGAAS
jgi:hypothetical protein